MLKKAGALLLVCAGMGAWVSCSLLTSSSNKYVYAAIPANDEIVAFREDPNAGVLTALAGSPYTAGPEVQSIVLHPSGKYLYGANAGQNNVSLFNVGSDGSLSEVSRTPAGTAPTLLAIDSAGAYLYVGNSGSFDISVFSISSTGVLTAVPQTSGTTFPIGLSPVNMAVAPSGNFLYVTGQGAVGYIEAFPLTQGVLGQPVTGSPFTTGNNPYGLVINPAGTSLYTANKIDESISEFTINSTPPGSISALPNSPVGEAYTSPVSLFIEKTGTYLYVANQGSSNLAAFTIASDGSLSLLSTSPFTTGSQPSFIAGDPSGKFLFVGNQSNPAVQSFSLDGSSGTLTSVATYKVAGTPTSIVVTH